MKTMRLCGCDIEVEEQDPGAWSSVGMGRSSSVHGKIVLRKDMPESVKSATLVHELLHMIADMNALEVGKDETAISVLATGLHAWMRDNKQLVLEVSE